MISIERGCLSSYQAPRPLLKDLISISTDRIMLSPRHPDSASLAHNNSNSKQIWYVRATERPCWWS